MSWDVMVMRLPPGATVASMPGDAVLPVLGARHEVAARIVAHLPQADFSDPAFGRIPGAGWWIDVNLREEAITSFTLHARGGEAVVDVVAGLLDHLGLQGVDTTTWEVFDREVARESLRAWRGGAVRAVDPTAPSAVEGPPDDPSRPDGASLGQSSLDKS